MDVFTIGVIAASFAAGWFVAKNWDSIREAFKDDNEDNQTPDEPSA